MLKLWVQGSFATNKAFPLWVFSRQFEGMHQTNKHLRGPKIVVLNHYSQFVVWKSVVTFWIVTMIRHTCHLGGKSLRCPMPSNECNNVTQLVNVSPDMYVYR